MTIFKASTSFGDRLISDGAPIVPATDRADYTLIGAMARASAVGGGIYGLPDRPDAPEVAEPDKRASVLTMPTPNDPAAQARQDVRVRLAQYVRLSGLRGVAVVSRGDLSTVHRAKSGAITALTPNVTARGAETRSVPIHLAGCDPSDPRAYMPDGRDATTGEQTASEVRDSRRYRDSSKGSKFAASMRRERDARRRGWIREAFPYLPYDVKHARFVDGVRTARETYYPDGTTLSERREAFFNSLSESERDDRRNVLDAASELAGLIAEQREDAKRQRKGRA